MNRVNEWKNLLELANKDLAKLNSEIGVYEEDGTYSVTIVVDQDEEEFACNYYEDELDEVINDAWAHARARAKKAMGVKIGHKIMTDGKKDEAENKLYIELEKAIPLKPDHAITQMCLNYATTPNGNAYFLQAYCTDTDGNGEYVDWDEIHTAAQNQLMDVLFN